MQLLGGFLWSEVGLSRPCCTDDDLCHSIGNSHGTAVFRFQHFHVSRVHAAGHPAPPTEFSWPETRPLPPATCHSHPSGAWELTERTRKRLEPGSRYWPFQWSKRFPDWLNQRYGCHSHSVNLFKLRSASVMQSANVCKRIQESMTKGGGVYDIWGICNIINNT